MHDSSGEQSASHRLSEEKSVCQSVSQWASLSGSRSKIYRIASNHSARLANKQAKFLSPIVVLSDIVSRVTERSERIYSGVVA